MEQHILTGLLDFQEQFYGMNYLKIYVYVQRWNISTEV